MKNLSKLMLSLVLGLVLTGCSAVVEEAPELSSPTKYYAIADNTEKTPLSISPFNNTKATPVMTVPDLTIDEEEEELESELIELPDCATDMYLYMDYRTITDRTTDQWSFQQENLMIDKKTGIQVYQYNDIDYYVVALGGVCGTDIGAAYKVTLDNGSEFYIVMGEVKANVHYGHTCTNFDGYYCINMIEFIVDSKSISDQIITMGTFSCMDFFKGNIQKLEYLGRIWEGTV